MQNKIRDKFRSQRLAQVSWPQRLLFKELQIEGKRSGFKPRLEHEIYTTNGVRFADIYIKRWHLNIDIDGSYHHAASQKLKDVQREDELWANKRQIVTLRFSNEEVMSDAKTVVRRILAFAQSLDNRPKNKNLPRPERKRLRTLHRKKTYLNTK